jgi:hypothetical protein
MTTILNEYINDVAATKLTDYVLDRFTEEEQGEYYREDYNYHLTYLIETWKNLIDEHFVENEFYYDINYDGSFECEYFVDGLYCPDFNNEWLDDIFERHILDTNVLK